MLSALVVYILDLIGLQEIPTNQYFAVMQVSPSFFIAFMIYGPVKLRIHWRLSTILETSNKSAWSNVFDM